MNAVLYTHQLEPITVIDLPMFLWDMLESGNTIAVPVFERPKVVPHAGEEPAMFRVVHIHAEPICRRENRALMLFTSDEESALLLRSSFLTGQRKDVQQRENTAFFNGFVDALQRMCRP